MTGRWLIGGMEKRCAEQFIKVESKQTDDEGKPDTPSTADTSSTGAVRVDQSYTGNLENCVLVCLCIVLDRGRKYP